MAADILLYDANIIPVGQDQQQHLEIARDIAIKFNNEYGEIFTLPEASIDENLSTLKGLDGQKMSKSYGNTIDIFSTEKVLRKQVMSIKTDSINLGSPINPDNCQVFYYHQLFGNPNLDKLRNQYLSGEIGFGDSKKQLFELIWEYFSESRISREKLSQDKNYITKIMKQGSGKARKIAESKIIKVRQSLGL
jgi:tryptophanyl-tRNA synthetase